MPPYEALPSLIGAPNFRDLGGHVAVDGRRLRSRRVFRSQVLAELGHEDLDVIRALGIGAVCDLRGHSESSKRRNRWPGGLEPVAIAPMVQARSHGANPMEWLKALTQPDFDLAQARGWMMDLYRQMPDDFAEHVGAVVRYLARSDSAPLLIHCEAGKDRTGFVCAVLLLALGVDEDAVYADYLLSAQHYRADALLERARHWLSEETLSDSAQESLAILATVHADYLRSALDALYARHGDAQRYLQEAVGIAEPDLQALRERLLTE